MHPFFPMSSRREPQQEICAPSDGFYDGSFDRSVKGSSKRAESTELTDSTRRHEVFEDDTKKTQHAGTPAVGRRRVEEGAGSVRAPCSR